MPEKLVIWGAGGYARVVSNIATLTRAFEVVGFLDDVQPERRGEAFCGAIVLGGAEQLEALVSRGVQCVAVAFGRSAARLRSGAALEANGLRLVTLVHPAAVVAPDVVVGEGTTVGAASVVDPGVTIGRCAILGSGVTVAHDCNLADGVRLSGGSHLGGAVQVGHSAMIGTGAIVRNGISIGAGTLVGAGAVVVNDLPAGVVAVGAPARVLRPVGPDDI